MVKANNYILKI